MRVKKRRINNPTGKNQTLTKANRTVPMRISQQKSRALDLWKSTRGYVSKVCEGLNISRTTFYSWIEKDKQFAIALAETEGELNDWVRDKLIVKIEEGNFQAVKFYLEKRHPDFKEAKQSINVQSNQFKVDFILDADTEEDSQ